jgi:hypothetical protein
MRDLQKTQQEFCPLGGTEFCTDASLLIRACTLRHDTRVTREALGMRVNTKTLAAGTRNFTVTCRVVRRGADVSEENILSIFIVKKRSQSRIHKKQEVSSSYYSPTLKTEETGYSETSGSYNPAERTLHSRNDDNLKSKADKRLAHFR